MDNNTSMYIDFNKDSGIFYDNLYLKDFNIVIKIPFPNLRKKISRDNMRVQEFNLMNSIFISSYY